MPLAPVKELARSGRMLDAELVWGARQGHPSACFLGSAWGRSKAEHIGRAYHTAPVMSCTFTRRDLRKTPSCYLQR